MVTPLFKLQLWLERARHQRDASKLQIAVIDTQAILTRLTQERDLIQAIDALQGPEWLNGEVQWPQARPMSAVRVLSYAVARQSGWQGRKGSERRVGTGRQDTVVKSFR